MRDSGWADASWHRGADPSPDVETPTMDMLVREGIEMDRQYVCESELPKFSAALPSHSAQLVFCADKYCSPTRTAIQSGRNPYHVNPLNADPDIYNPADPVSGMASMPRNSPSPLRQQNQELMKLTGAALVAQ